MSYTMYKEWLLINSAKPQQLQTSRNAQEEARKSEREGQRLFTRIESAALHNMSYTFHS
jgi:hypothetical protein